MFIGRVSLNGGAQGQRRLRRSCRAGGAATHAELLPSSALATGARTAHVRAERRQPWWYAVGTPSRSSGRNSSLSVANSGGNAGRTPGGTPPPSAQELRSQFLVRRTQRTHLQHGTTRDAGKQRNRLCVWVTKVVPTSSLSRTRSEVYVKRTPSPCAQGLRPHWVERASSTPLPSQSPSLLSPGCSLGRTPCSHRKFRSASVIGTSLMLACRSAM